MQINRSLFSHCSGGWMSETKLLSEPYPSNGYREEPFLASSWLLVVAGNPWHSLALWTHLSVISLHFYMVFFPLCASVSLYPSFPLLSLIRTAVIGLRAHPTPVWAGLNLITSTKVLFPSKFAFTLIRSGLEHIFWETFQPSTSAKGKHDWFAYRDTEHIQDTWFWEGHLWEFRFSVSYTVEDPGSQQGERTQPKSLK